MTGSSSRPRSTSRCTAEAVCKRVERELGAVFSGRHWLGVHGMRSQVLGDSAKHPLVLPYLQTQRVLSSSSFPFPSFDDSPGWQASIYSLCDVSIAASQRFFLLSSLISSAHEACSAPDRVYISIAPRLPLIDISSFLQPAIGARTFFNS